MDRSRRGKGVAGQTGLRIAGIDIGTNTALLLIADISSDGIPHPVVQVQRFPRLGRNVDADRLISSAGFAILAEVMEEYSGIIQQYTVDAVAAWATSAMRDARNSGELIAHIRTLTGIEIEIISGETEAVWTYRGALSGLPGLAGSVAVLDIGGGSTEISYQSTQQQLQRYSMQLGAVRLTEQAVPSLPPTAHDLSNARTIIANSLEQLPAWNASGFQLVGVAGSVTTLACLDQGLMEFASAKVNGYVLSIAAIEKWFSALARLAPKEIETLSTTTHGRADILTAGVLILLEVMKRYEFESITVSDRGLRFGVVMREWESRQQS